MAGKTSLDVVTSRDKGRIAHIDSATIKARTFARDGSSNNVIYRCGEFYIEARPGDYFVYEEGKVDGRSARLCERVVRIGAVEQICDKQVILAPADKPAPEFKRYLLMEEIVNSEVSVSEGSCIVYRAGKLIVERGVDTKGKPVEESSAYSCYALATDREAHAVEKRTH